MRRPACSIMRRTRSGRADRRSNWRRVAPRSSAAGSVAPSRGEREPSRRRSPQPPAASRQLAVAVAAAAAAAVSELLRRVADAVWTRAAQRRASLLGVGSARARADGACKQTACTAHSFKMRLGDHLASGILPRSCPQQAFDQNPNFPTPVEAALGPEKVFSRSCETCFLGAGHPKQQGGREG